MATRGNLLAAGIRQRRNSGLFAILIALALSALVLRGVLPPIALFGVFFVHAYGFLGLFQAQTAT